MKFIITICIALSMLTGCVGLSYTSFEAKTSNIQLPIVSQEKGFLLHEGKSISPEKLIEYWGKPSSKITSGEAELWTYKFSEADKGFFALLVIIPIPVFLDDGFEQITFTIRNEEIVNAEARYQYESGFGCMAVFLVHGLVNSVCNSKKEHLKQEIPLVFYKN
jgi:hypothetical protein